MTYEYQTMTFTNYAWLRFPEHTLTMKEKFIFLRDLTGNRIQDIQLQLTTRVLTATIFVLSLYL